MWSTTEPGERGRERERDKTAEPHGSQGQGLGPEDKGENSGSLHSLLPRFLVKHEVVSFPTMHVRVTNHSGFPLFKNVCDTSSLRNHNSSS